MVDLSQGLFLENIIWALLAEHTYLFPLFKMGVSEVFVSPQPNRDPRVAPGRSHCFMDIFNDKISLK